MEEKVGFYNREKTKGNIIIFAAKQTAGQQISWPVVAFYGELNYNSIKQSSEAE